MKTPFDSKVCSRCNGTKNHSFNMAHGTVCFKCDGKGYTLTAKGKRQCEKYTELVSVSADQIRIGNIFKDSFSGKWVRVDGVTNNGDLIKVINTNSKTNTETSFSFIPSKVLRIAVSEEKNQEAIAEALKVK